MGLKLGRRYPFGAVLVFLKNFTESIYRFPYHTNDRNHYDNSLNWAVFDERKGFWQRARTCGWRRWACSSSIIKIVSARQRIYPSWWILRILLPHFIRKVLVARAWIHVVAKWERDQFCREVYSIETLLHITCQIISELKHPRYCFPKFVSIWPAPEVVDGIFEVCPPATKFCPLVNKPVALGFSLWWQIFDINKQFCPLVRLGPYSLILWSS